MDEHQGFSGERAQIGCHGFRPPRHVDVDPFELCGSVILTLVALH